jgi:PTH1 family peptidyl-tRNA hydrolase
VKPLTEVADAGHVVKLVLDHYQIKNPSKQLIVAFNDTNTLPGTIMIQHGSDARGADQHRGTKNIFEVLGHKEFIRIRLGIGRATSMPDDQYVLESFQENHNEVNIFGYTLDITGQALQHIIAFGDVKATKKKYCSSKKLPKSLRQV